MPSRIVVKKHRSKERAQAIVEFAIVLPILMVMLVGIIEVGRLIYAYAAVINASREAARYASAVGYADNTTYKKFQYCAGIREVARKAAFPVIITDSEISITYDHGDLGSTFETCDGTVDTGITINSGTNFDRATVRINTTFRPAIKLIPIRPQPIESRSSRTILGIYELPLIVSSGGGGGGGSGGGGGGGPTATFTATATEGPTETPTFTPTATATQSGGYTPLPTFTATSTATATATATSTSTATPTATATIACTAASVTLPASADAWISEANPTTNKAADTTLTVTSKDNNSNARALVQFTLPAMPPGCKIQSATLRLYDSNVANNRNIQALRIISGWTESGVIWSNQPGTTTANLVAVNAKSGYMEWIVTSMVNDMYANANYGFMIKDEAENSNSSKSQQFNSKENTANKPELVIVYTQGP